MVKCNFVLQELSLLIDISSDLNYKYVIVQDSLIQCLAKMNVSNNWLFLSDKVE